MNASAAIGGIGAIAGGIQAIVGGIATRKANRALEKQVNEFTPNASINDFYQKALSRYNPNPYQSATYQQQNNQIGRNLATGINATQSRRGGLSSIGGLTQQANDASLKAIGMAEQQAGQDLSRLGQASNMKTQEDQKKFDMMYNLKAMKAGQAASTTNTGLSNLYGGLANVAYSTNGLDGNNGGGGSRGYSAGANAYKMPRIRANV